MSIVVPRSRFVRTMILGVAVGFVLALVSTASAESMPVPVDLQSELLVKVADFERNLPPRSRGRVKVVVLSKSANATSNLVAHQMKAALGRVSQIAGLPHEEAIVDYSGAAALAAMCRSEHISIIYLAPGMSDEIDGIRDALGGVDVLTVSGVPDYVRKGIVLGFDVVSGKPKLLLHLPQAKKQNVSFASRVISIMKIYE